MPRRRFHTPSAPVDTGESFFNSLYYLDGRTATWTPPTTLHSREDYYFLASIIGDPAVTFTSNTFPIYSRMRVLKLKRQVLGEYSRYTILEFIVTMSFASPAGNPIPSVELIGTLRPESSLRMMFLTHGTRVIIDPGTTCQNRLANVANGRLELVLYDSNPASTPTTSYTVLTTGSDLFTPLQWTATTSLNGVLAVLCTNHTAGEYAQMDTADGSARYRSSSVLCF